MLSAEHDGTSGRRRATCGSPSAAEPPPSARDELDALCPASGRRGKNVLVALHGRGAPVAAVEVGRIIAGALGVPLHGLFVCAEPIDACEVPARIGVDPEALRGVVLHVEASDDLPGALAAAIERRSSAFVVVTSGLEEDMDERLGVGRLAARALETAACGVVVVGPAPLPTRLRRILLPLDGAPSTAASISPVGELARKLDAELDIVMIGGASPRDEDAEDAPPVSTPTPSESGAMVAPLYVDQPQHEWPAFAEEFLGRFLNAIGHCPHDVSTRFFLGTGEPAAEILRFAAQLGSDLMVLVWSGELDGHHGCVFRDVLCRAPCPVMVLRR